MRQLNIKKIARTTLLLMTAVCIAATAATPLAAQYEYYYSQNKVKKQKFNWKYLESDHFKLYYYIDNKDLVNKIAKHTEESYKKISDYLNVKVEKKFPIILFSTEAAFLRNNITGYLPQGVIAFAEPGYNRVVIHAQASWEDLAHTITHELGHIFEYAIMGRSARYARTPLWVAEGFSDFITGHWGQFNLLVVRDLVLTNNIPQMQKNGNFSGNTRSRTLAYDFGHMVYEFLDEKYGKRGIKKLLYSLKGGSFFKMSGRGNVLRVLDMNAKTFNYEFGKWVRNRFRKFTTKEDPEDYSYIIGPDFPYVYAFSHKVSPSGEMLAVLTGDMKNQTLRIILVSMKDGKVIAKLTPGFTTRYDFINLNFDPTYGSIFTWGKDGNMVAFFAKKDVHDYLVLLDVLKQKVIKQIKIDIQSTTSPVFHPTENKLYFTGQEATSSYIYSMDLDTENITKLTDGYLFIKAMDISRDGKRVVFSARAKDKYYKLFLGTIEKPEMAKQLTFGDYNDITPSFSTDGKRIYYSSDELESYNINSVDLEEQVMYRYTDVKTGNFYPLEIPEEEDMIVMTSYYRGNFSMLRKDISEPQYKRKLAFEMVDKELLAKKESEATDVSGLNLKDRGKYKPLSRLYVQSLPPLSVSVGSDGGLFGYTYLSMTDLLGDHNFTLMISSLYGYRSYHLFYLNQSRRLQLFTHLFAYQEVYYYNTYSGTYDSLTLRSQYGAEVGVFYPFSRETRVEATVSFYKRKENLDAIYGFTLPYGQYFSGWALPVRLSLVNQNTRFSNATMGPLSGSTFKLTAEKYIPAGDEFLDAYVLSGDYRKYLRISNDALFAFRAVGYKSGGKFPLIMWTGGNNTIRTVDYRRLVGNNMFLFNAEFRFPLVKAALTPLGLIGPIRGVFFFDLGGIWFDEQDFRVFEKGKGLKLQDARASYGFGLVFNIIGYPMHLEWVTRTDLRKKRYYGVNFWIGFDF